jgi:hypothetical protein
MSVLVTTNCIKDQSGFPFNPLFPIEIAEIASLLHQNGVAVDTFNGQSMDYEAWKTKILKLQPKILILNIQESHIQLFKSLKSELNSTKIVAISKNSDLINSFIFDYGFDYVYYSKNLAGLPLLIKTMSQTFSPFYDHISGIAYKNGMGEITKTNEPNELLEKVEISNLFLPKDENYFLPEHLKSTENTDNQVINSGENKVLTDFLGFKKGQNYDSAFLQIPASKKALEKVLEIIENINDSKNIHIYPSCDLVDDRKIYSKMGTAIAVSIEMKNSNFLKKFFLSLKLNNLRSI